MYSLLYNQEITDNISVDFVFRLFRWCDFVCSCRWKYLHVILIYVTY